MFNQFSPRHNLFFCLFFCSNVSMINCIICSIIGSPIFFFS